MRATLPRNCELVIGEVGNTVGDFHRRLDGGVRAFAAYDLDRYSSTVRVLPFLTFEPTRFLPVVPMYFDDDHKAIT